MIFKGYKSTPTHVMKHVLTLLYIFFERHKLGCLPEISWIWYEELQNKTTYKKVWRRCLKVYEAYVSNGDIPTGNKYKYNENALDLYPKWCSDAINEFQECMTKEFKSPVTVDKYKFACMRFCSFLLAKDISAFDEITPDLIMEFSLTDEHETFKGRYSYFTVIRRFLCYLEDTRVISNRHLHLLLSPGKAQEMSIVDILTKDDEATIL